MTSNSVLPITTRRATVADAAMLADLATRAFHDTYAAENTPGNMALYIAMSFGESLQRAELEDRRVVVLLAERGDDVVGYAMLRDGPAPEAVGAADGIEIARLYAVKPLIGAGIGATLMQRCLDEAEARGKSIIWLGVWEHNARALAFYHRWEFADVGTLEFTLGRDRQTDRLMMRRVDREK
ncbi:MAG: GCN5-like N-acetyltransferase [Gemmatimonadetes bacterium]|nr:GCN5-like N-acetyltransferase [Gemmatimonadota bacterium]